MARKQYDLSKGSATYGSLLEQYGVRSLGGRKYQLHGQFASAEQIVSVMAGSYSGGLQTFQSPLTGKTLPIDPVMRIMELLEDSVPREEWDEKGYRGGGRIDIPPIAWVEFDFAFPAGFFGELSKAKGAVRRFGIVMRERTVISNVLSDEIEEWGKRQIPEIKAIIAGVIEERVYNKEVELIRYFKRGKPHEPSPNQFRGLDEGGRTGNLLRAFTEGVKATSFGISFGVDESFAPYWLWVEKGHRVIMPTPIGDGTYVMMETGTFVKGRPFVEEIEVKVQEYLNRLLGNFTVQVAARATDAIAQWVANGEGGKGRLFEYELGAKTVKYFPRMGYGDEFAKYVGLI